jgi:hypothetical protein
MYMGYMPLPSITVDSSGVPTAAWVANLSGAPLPIQASRLGPTAPSAPATPIAVAGNAQATVTVAAGSGNGGTPTSYTVTAVEDNAKTCTVTGVSGSCEVTGLANGTSYTFKATATNDGGTSGLSAASSAVIPQAPATPPATAPATPEAPSTSASNASTGTPSATNATTPALNQRAPQQQNGVLTTTGVVPDGATRVIQIASGGSAQMAQMAFGARAMTRVTANCPISSNGGTRTYTCRARLGAGTWTITTQAKAGSKVIAQSVKSVRVKATTRTAVTG